MKFRFTQALAAALLAACVVPAAAQLSSAQLTYRVPDQPEGSSGYSPKPGWAARTYAVAAANPLATDAGYQILKAGGSAVDAAVAVQMVLALVEPQSSGIAGGAFLLHFDGREVAVFDGRETAPAAADENLFIGADGKPMLFQQAVVGGRSVGVPGAVRMLEMAHRQYGKLPWATLFQPAIALAEKGFRVSLRLHTLASGDADLRKDAQSASYFFSRDGKAREPGYLLKNPDLAYVLRKIAAEGSIALHDGEIARAIVSKVRSHASNPGKMTLADLAGYQAKKREPLCYDYATQMRSFQICGVPPPSSGAIAIGQILGTLSNTPAASYPLVPGMGVPGTTGFVPSAEFLHLYTDASRLAYADRAQYIADPDFVEAPDGNWMSLLEPRYLASRSNLIDASPQGQSMKVAKPGAPGSMTARYAPMPEQEEHGTSHISIVDAQGNAIAMTTTIEAQFGSRQMVNVSGQPGGFMLNNELTDFSFAPKDAQGIPIANRVQGGKRPRSSMAPTLIFTKPGGNFVMSVGSPGGAVIIHFTAKTIYGVLNWGINAQQAIDLPNFGSTNGPTFLEQNRFPRTLVEALRKRGAEVLELELPSGLQAIQTAPFGLYGGADPRREGIVIGD
ncbi:MAG: gamma-glutamyltransferase family protein [Ramlibacter sp.]|nr:gamma-glutamyltransferase family protein [Ramlibacter sp.]